MIQQIFKPNKSKAFMLIYLPVFVRLSGPRLQLASVYPNKVQEEKGGPTLKREPHCRREEKRAGLPGLMT